MVSDTHPVARALRHHPHTDVAIGIRDEAARLESDLSALDAIEPTEAGRASLLALASRLQTVYRACRDGGAGADSWYLGHAHRLAEREIQLFPNDERLINRPGWRVRF